MSISQMGPSNNSGQFSFNVSSAGGLSNQISGINQRPMMQQQQQPRFQNVNMDMRPMVPINQNQQNSNQSGLSQQPIGQTQVTGSSITLQGPGPGGGPTQQQAPAPQSTNQSGGTASSTDPEKRKLIQLQLVLLLHAHKCQRRENQSNTEVRIFFSILMLLFFLWGGGVPYMENMVNLETNLFAYNSKIHIISEKGKTKKHGRLRKMKGLIQELKSIDRRITGLV